MKTSAEYLDAIKAKHHLSSDYAAAKLLGVTRSAVSKYRNGQSNFDESVSVRAAELLDLDPCELLLSSQAERAHDAKTRALWLMLAKKAGYAAGVALFAAGMVSTPTPARAAPTPEAHDWYYVKRRGRLLLSYQKRRPGFRDDEEPSAPPPQIAEKPRNSGFFFAC